MYPLPWTQENIQGIAFCQVNTLQKLAALFDSFATKNLFVIGAAIAFFVIGLTTFYKRPLVGTTLFISGFLIVTAAILSEMGIDVFDFIKLLQ